MDVNYGKQIKGKGAQRDRPVCWYTKGMYATPKLH